MSNDQEARTRLAIVVGGGPAPGINGVIAAATGEALRQGLEVFGIEEGFKRLAKGDASRVRPLTWEEVERARGRGGSILYTSRENPTTSDEKMQNVLKALREHGIGYLVTIGGDDTALSACKIWERSQGAIRVAHVPKTIDNDLPLPKGIPTFGFQTARQVGARLVANLVEDARTTRRWYVVVAMGRSAGHLALGMGAAAGADLTLIPEEFLQSGINLELLCEILEGAMFKGRMLGRDYGVAVLAEGLGELLKEELKDHPIVVIGHDDFGSLRLADVPLALILRRRLQARAKDRGKELGLVDLTIGYELRCADPIAFDAQYTEQLGWGAVRYLLGTAPGSVSCEGALISIQAGELKPIPFAEIMDTKTGKTAVRRVALDSAEYQAARSAMVRLAPADLEDADTLKRLSQAAGIAPADFRVKYSRAAAAG
ncbi:MAG: 6-phosphofructokinase [Pirellulales bacterium]|nr:6-phosphofructokinase [Pirellulales bacterium]